MDDGLEPYLFALGLSVWTLVYGEHHKKKAEQLATAAGTRAAVAVDAER